jgi:hypothetical protein
VREIRSWKDGRWFRNSKLGFHLDYDRHQQDYGDLMVRLRLERFKYLRLQDGDHLELDLVWKGRHPVRLRSPHSQYNKRPDLNAKLGLGGIGVHFAT